jgi:arylsulfatase A-like enzyme
VGLVLAGCGASERPGAPERVLLVVTDATHAGRIRYGDPSTPAPELSKLAAEGVRFSRAFSNTTWTLASTASLMTGQLQETHGAVTKEHVLPDSATTLAELFTRAGWETAAFVQMAYAAPDFGFGQGFGEFDYAGLGGKRGNTIPRVLDWMRERADGHWFVYLHLRRPHSPYRPKEDRSACPPGCALADGSRDAELEFADLFEDRELEPFELAHVEHLYDANLAAVDQQLGHVFPVARAAGALIIHTSDHGEALGEHGAFGHGKHLWGESIDIPLVFWWPGATPRADAGPACTVDVLPTIVELCGLGSPASPLDGRSLAPRLTANVPHLPRPIIATARYSGSAVPRVAVIEGDWKLVQDIDGTSELYDRLRDPADRTDRTRDEPEVTSRLAAIADRWRRTHADAAARGDRRGELAPELIEDLRGLGYNE